jgi:hypothetical protein
MGRKTGTRMQGHWWGKRLPKKPDYIADHAWSWYLRHVTQKETLRDIAASDGVPVSRVGTAVRHIHSIFEPNTYGTDWFG